MDEHQDSAETTVWSPPATELPRTDVALPVADGEPERVGRYAVRRLLGMGSFGRVYLAHDGDLNRLVAIKVPRPERVLRAQDIEAYLAEARVVATLNHPHIVPVYDVGHTEDGLCYVVSRYIDGQNLANFANGPRLHARSAELVAKIADTLHYAHGRGLVHRDIKPANLLIDGEGKPHVADFGMALKETDFGKGPGFAGTPAYMSPEQARGEGHRVDGRSDIFSLGVVFYELLTGRRPFRAGTQHELLEQIASTDCRPPRQWDDTIPRELERICLKAMSRRASERYTTAGDMAEDLGSFLKGACSVSTVPASTTPSAAPSTQQSTPLPESHIGPQSESRPIKIVPKGLRTFDEHDADAFLELLPGPRDRDGLPDSIRFWKLRIEETDPDKTFAVGLVYGPSGCGKSSLVKAGLLPRLRTHVIPVYVEATPEETEVRLLKGLRKACPELSAQQGLVESLAALRRGEVVAAGRKVSIVLDQFEQWLHARGGVEGPELLSALRQCDGGRVQAVVMVRDDFWMAATRFLKDLEVRLLEGDNSAAVDLFDSRHARKVLAAFGRAFGALPERAGDLSREQDAFLDQAVVGLAERDKVVSVRLSLFAEMVKAKPWAPATLKQVGGIEGVGVTFLEEMFSAATAPPGHRLHQKAARSVLKALLPDSGSDIKGHMRSHEELLEASGYATRPREFGDLLHILDSEVRLITPTDPEGLDAEEPARPDRKYYQLTHDYLVPSLRTWLTRKQRETRRGRAELRLAERAALWHDKPENRFLPSAWEWARIRALTRSKDWTPPQHRMMRQAARAHGLRAVGLFCAIALAGWIGIEGYASLRATALVEKLETASTTEVPSIIDQLRPYRRWAARPLDRVLANTGKHSGAHLRASLADFALTPGDSKRAEFLEDRLLAASPADLPVIWGFLRAYGHETEQRLWKQLDDPMADADRRFRAACALANSDSAAVEDRWKPATPFITDAFLDAIRKNPSNYSVLIEVLRPIRRMLLPPLAAVFRDSGRSESERSFATTILADYASDRPDALASLLMDAEPKAFMTIFPAAQQRTGDVVARLLSEVSRQPGAEASESASDQLAERQARAAVALVRLGKAEAVWPLLKHSAGPRLRSFIINRLKPLGTDPRTLVAGLDGIDAKAVPAPASGQPKMDAILFHPETSMRRALILALGTYGTEGLTADERTPLIARLLDTYRNDADAGIHGAAEWTLRQWRQEEALRKADAELVKTTHWGERRWFVNAQGQSFAVIDGPVEFVMGSPETELNRDGDETSHRVRIPRRFAVATKEVSRALWQRFVKQHPEWNVDAGTVEKYSPHTDGPMLGFSWYIAAAFCNWLSEQEGLTACYEPNSEGRYAAGMRIKADGLSLSGYRLPTEAEWEYACRSGAMTSRYYGAATDLLGAYARYQANGRGHAWSCGGLVPNDLGLFDMLGNEFEWCQDDYSHYQADRLKLDSIANSEVINESPRLLRGGTFLSPAVYVRSADRGAHLPSYLNADFGFRPARTCD